MILFQSRYHKVGGSRRVSGSSCDVANHWGDGGVTAHTTNSYSQSTIYGIHSFIFGAEGGDTNSTCSRASSGMCSKTQEDVVSLS